MQKQIQFYSKNFIKSSINGQNDPQKGSINGQSTSFTIKLKGQIYFKMLFI